MRRYDTTDLGEFVLLRKPGEFAPTRIRMAIPADSDLSDVLDVVASFLRACGYHVPLDAALDLVNASTGRPYDEEPDLPMDSEA